MYISRPGDGTCEFDGLYTLLRLVLNSLVHRFRAEFTDEIAITIKDDRSVTICYPRKKIKNITIVESENDRLIKENKIEILKRDVDSKVVKLKDIGHTPILEDYDSFVRIIKEELKKV